MRTGMFGGSAAAAFTVVNAGHHYCFLQGTAGSHYRLCCRAPFEF